MGPKLHIFLLAAVCAVSGCAVGPEITHYDKPYDKPPVLRMANPVDAVCSHNGIVVDGELFKNLDMYFESGPKTNTPFLSGVRADINFNFTKDLKGGTYTLNGVDIVMSGGHNFNYGPSIDFVGEREKQGLVMSFGFGAGGRTIYTEVQSFIWLGGERLEAHIFKADANQLDISAYNATAAILKALMAQRGACAAQLNQGPG